MQRQVMGFTLPGQLTKTNQISDCIFVHSVCNAISMTQVFSFTKIAFCFFFLREDCTLLWQYIIMEYSIYKTYILPYFIKAATLCTKYMTT